ncbi:zinc finger BED domain-containing protein RICESLEEPER 2-like protein [Tanacetum coccineum]
MGYFQIIRVDGSSRRYSSMIMMLQNIDREDMETLWKLVKAEHGNTRPEEAYERDVIENRNLFKPAAQTITNANGTSTTLIPGLVTTKEKVQKKNDVKARSMLLMALPNEHLMTFNQYKDTKTFAPSTESLDSIFNRHQKINTHVVVWRNKPDLDTMSFDDLYNNFKISEQEVKGTASSSLSSQNMAFVSSPSSINEVNTAYEKTGRKITINESDTAGYDKSKVECFNCHKMGYFARECRGPRNQDSRNRNQDSSRRTVNVEETSSKDMVAINGAGFNWSYMADDEVPTNMALMDFSDFEVHNDKTCSKTCLKSFETLKTQLDDLRIEFNKSEFNLATYKRGLASIEDQLVFYKKNEVIVYEQLAGLKRDISYKDSEIRLFLPPKFDLSNFGLEEFQQPKFEGYGPKNSKSVSEDISNEVRESPDAPLVKELVSDDKLEKKTIFPTVAKIEFVRPKQQDKLVRKPVKYAEMYRLTAITIKGKGWNMVPRSVLIKTNLRSLNTARPVNTAHPKTTVYSARPMSHFSKSTQSTIKRLYQIRTALTNKNYSQKVNTAKGKFYTAWPKAVNTVRPNSTVVNVVRANQVNAVKASACWVWRPTKLNSASITLKRNNYVDARGKSKHMTGNMSYLSDFKEFDRGYVTFRGGAKGGKITGKGTLKTGKLDFKDMYFVKELQFNLFSVLQMCDKKNSVLFTNTGCVVLSPDFKLTDESQVLLNVPRKNNMYSVDMKNIVPKESLTCLVTKATLDESMKWHKRLGKVTQSLLFTWVFFLASKDEIGGILKNFIIEIENLVDKKVMIIRCDNGTEFKNRVMSEFCKQKGIKREFSVARIPLLNDVAERRNRTLIEAARTMLVDFKLPITFWAEAVNTACYVQNRVLVVKPYNKTPYELFRGRKHALSFTRPFGCHVTILNTLDYLGKFDGKSDEGFFVGYSMNSKAFRVYNIRTRKIEENLHIRFLEDKPIIAGDGPKWPFDIDVLTKSMNYVPVVAGTNSNDSVGTEENIGTCQSSKETGSSQDYILMPMWKDGSLFNSSLKNASNDEPQPSSNAGKKEDEEIHMSNITTTYLVPSTPNTRIHKDHSLDHVIGDVPSGVLTRRMTKTTNEQGFISVVYKGKTHEDLHTYLFACFLSRVEPKKVIQALKDPSWIEAMQEELLQFKLQQVWTLVDLPHGKRTIGTKWVYKNKKDKRGIVIRNKARLVAQGYTQEEGIDYDDVKSAFLYGKIEEEVYVTPRQ